MPPDGEDDRPRPLLGPLFWTLMAIAALCVIAGAGVALLGPKLWPPPAPVRTAAP